MKYEFTLDEVRAIYRIIENEWINRDDDGAMAVSDKVSKIVAENRPNEKVSDQRTDAGTA